jgi:hypothetical protein
MPGRSSRMNQAHDNSTQLRSLWLGLLPKVGLAVAWAFFGGLVAHGLTLPDSAAGALASHWGLNRPDGWIWFLRVLAPLGLLLMSLAGHCLAAVTGRAPDRRDWLAYLVLPLLLGFTALHNSLPAWPLLCGLAYLLALTWQMGLSCAVLWQNSQHGASLSHRQLSWGLGGLSLALYLALTLWVVQAVGTSGDETIYLIDADRLLASLGLSAGDAASPAKRLAFYWGRWSPALAAPLGEGWAFITLLAPGFGLAGRIGALAILGLAGAACLGIFTSLGLRLGYQRGTVLLAALLLGFSLPLLQMTQHVYPGVLGALLVTLGLRLLPALGGRSWQVLSALAGIGLLLVLVKFRLAPVALGLLLTAWLAAWQRLPGWRRGLAWGGLAGAAILAGLLGAALVGVPGLESLARELKGIPKLHLTLMSLTVPGQLFDQQFGLLAYAPWMLLALAAMPRFGREQPGMLLYSAVIFCMGFGLLTLWRWLQWYGGFTPPTRYLTPLLPILALWALPALQRGGAWLWRLLVASLALLSWALAFAYTLAPQWRFHRRTGINNLLGWLGDTLGSVLHRFFPSFNEAAGVSWAPLLFWLALLAAAAVYLWRRPQPAPSVERPPWRGASLTAAALALLLVVAGGLIGLGRTLPSGALPAENLLSSHSILHGDYYDQPVQLVLRRPGDWGQTTIIGGGPGHLTVTVRRYRGTPAVGAPPVLAFLVDGKEVGRLSIPDASWRNYSFGLQAEPGPHRLRVLLASSNGRDAVGLDRLELVFK